MSSPIFAMSLEVVPSDLWLPRPSARSRSAMTTPRDFQEAPVYIRGFPGYDHLKANETSSTNFNPYSMESSDTSHTSQHQVRLDLNEFRGTNQFEDLMDQLQLREDDHNAATGRHPPNHFAPQKRTSHEPQKSLTELSTLFIQMFHTQYCKIDKKHTSTPFEDTHRKFFLMYMRQWEDLITTTRSEKACIQDFKRKHHDKLCKDEWTYLCTFLKKTTFVPSTNGFQDFCALLKTPPSSSSSTPLGTSPSTDMDSASPSCLSLTLQSMNTSAAAVNFSIEELKKLYVCLYFENYRELWDSDKFVLSGALAKSVESFLGVNPTIDPSILASILQYERNRET
eukprot:TRINITY_DN3731_c0_g1_i1.p1 TRINITY_DN3731_c0_g1~~TRINITY_DN3731_c0_g1_i1.p1  ORF type:complete len:339 (+),score=63.53 TRINITY_DN3731_c0_g1_i1:319-1335(+)